MKKPASPNEKTHVGPIKKAVGGQLPPYVFSRWIKKHIGSLPPTSTAYRTLCFFL